MLNDVVPVEYPGIILDGLTFNKYLSRPCTTNVSHAHQAATRTNPSPHPLMNLT